MRYYLIASFCCFITQSHIWDFCQQTMNGKVSYTTCTLMERTQGQKHLNITYIRKNVHLFELMRYFKIKKRDLVEIGFFYHVLKKHWYTKWKQINVSIKNHIDCICDNQQLGVTAQRSLGPLTWPGAAVASSGCFSCIVFILRPIK